MSMIFELQMIWIPPFDKTKQNRRNAQESPWNEINRNLFLFSLFLLLLPFISGYFPLESVHCLVWMCLDVLFCTASIMHLCTISIDRYLSLRYPMRFGRNKTRKRVTVKIIFVWILSIAMSLPLCLMYSKVSIKSIENTSSKIPVLRNKWLPLLWNFSFLFSIFIILFFSFRNRIMRQF